MPVAGVFAPSGRCREPVGGNAYGVGMRTTIAVLLGIIAILAIAAGVVYAVVPAHSLPTFVPGYAKVGKHTHRGLAGIAVGVILLVIAIVVGRSGRRRRHWR